MQDIFEVSDIYVIKVGSSTLVDATGEVDTAYIQKLADDIAAFKAAGNHVIVVSSGAVAAGMKRLHMHVRPSDIPSLQACAAAGQALLTEAYAQALGAHGISVGQVLLTRHDVCSRETYLNARTTIGTLLHLGAVPVVNENDTVSVAEFTFGDNDTLGAIVATLVHADAYIIYTDVDGLYTANPATDSKARHIDTVHKITPELIACATGSVSGVGTGGMSTKLYAARAALAAGITTIICNGHHTYSLDDIVNNRVSQTRFVPESTHTPENARKLWIGIAEIPQGSVTVDAGAKQALIKDGASLLPVGIREVKGSFHAGDVISVRDEHSSLIARGISKYSSDDLCVSKGLKLDVIARFMPQKANVPVIHKDELLLF